MWLRSLVPCIQVVTLKGAGRGQKHPRIALQLALSSTTTSLNLRLPPRPLPPCCPPRLKRSRSGRQSTTLMPSCGLLVWEGTPPVSLSLPRTIEHWFQIKVDSTHFQTGRPSITQTTLFSSRKQRWEVGGAGHGLQWVCAGDSHLGARGHGAPPLAGRGQPAGLRVAWPPSPPRQSATPGPPSPPTPAPCQSVLTPLCGAQCGQL